MNTPGLSGFFYDLRLKHENTISSGCYELKHDGEQALETGMQLSQHNTHANDTTQVQQRRLLKPASRKTNVNVSGKNSVSDKAPRIQAPKLNIKGMPLMNVPPHVLTRS